MKRTFNFVETERLETSLAELSRGEHAVLGDLKLSDSAAQHLMCLGFVPGVEVVVGPSGPGGDPRVYQVDGTNVALRRETARFISARRAALEESKLS